MMTPDAVLLSVALAVQGTFTINPGGRTVTQRTQPCALFVIHGRAGQGAQPGEDSVRIRRAPRSLDHLAVSGSPARGQRDPGRCVHDPPTTPRRRATSVVHLGSRRPGG